MSNGDEDSEKLVKANEETTPTNEAEETSQVDANANASSSLHTANLTHYVTEATLPVSSNLASIGYVSTHIDDIIEEEEEEEEDEEEREKLRKKREEEEKEKLKNETSSNQDKKDDENKETADEKNAETDEKEVKGHTPMPSIPEGTSTENENAVQHSKFTLEPVVLEEGEQAALPSNLPPTSTTENETLNERSNSLSVEGKAKKPRGKVTISDSPVASKEPETGNESHNEDHGDTDANDDANSDEIRVEEGYATRQMDEYFRQTIAAIKEELTKKTDDPEDDIGEFDSNDEFNSSDEACENDEYDLLSDQYSHLNNDIDYSVNLSCDGLPTTRNQQNRRSYYRNQLVYQHMLNSTLAANASSTMNDQNTCTISWLVILGLFINQFIIDGLLFNYATLIKPIETKFNITSKLVASLPNILLLGFYLLVAPLAIFMSKRFGCRRIALIGTFLSATSLFAASYMTNMIAFTFFYGILNGIGVSLVYIPGLITLSKWFLRKRLFANSLATIGATFGAIVYPLMSDFCLKKYELKGTLFVIASIQLNLFVGSLLLRDRKSMFTRLIKTNADSMKRPRAGSQKVTNENEKINSSAAPLLPNEGDQQEQQTENIEMTPSKTAKLTINNETNKSSIPVRPSYQNTRRMLMKQRMNNGRGPGVPRTESDIVSNASTSTAVNYTLKQYWRKFVQTRKTEANTKKNLFHLIAEEKKKNTRAMSKASLEDGFVITRSNNLLAPNDEENVIVSIRQANAAAAAAAAAEREAAMATPSAKSGASRFFSRIANSIRSVAFGGGSIADNLVTSGLSKNQLANQYQSNTLNKTNLNASQSPTVNDPANTSPSVPLKSKMNPTTIQEGVSTHDNNNPGSNADSNDQVTTAQSSAVSDMPANLASVFGVGDNIASTGAGYDESSQVDSDSDSGGGGDDENDDQDDQDDDEAKSPNMSRRLSKQKNKKLLASNLPASTTGSNYKFNRYMSYRSSLTNSMRGSLLECSVPEHPETEDDRVRLQNGVSTRFTKAAINNAASNMVRNTNRSQKNARNQPSMASRIGNALPPISNVRRVISIVEAASIYNLPLNLEPVQHNLRNCLIKKSADEYRAQQKNRGHLTYGDESSISLFIDFLNYMIDLKLFFNPLLLLINFALFLSIVGFAIPLMYLIEFANEKTLTRSQSIYVLCVFALTIGLGRIVSTLAFKVQTKSNAKGRLFLFHVALFIASLLPAIATVLCDTVFSFMVFVATLGVLLGLYLSLRPLIIYDMLSMEWNDDSFTIYGLLAQSIGALIGLPLAGLIIDVNNNYESSMYFSSACLMISFLLLTPGRELQDNMSEAYKSINKYYFQKKS